VLRINVPRTVNASALYAIRDRCGVTAVWFPWFAFAKSRGDGRSTSEIDRSFITAHLSRIIDKN
jgi:hypothetical protein